MTTNKKIQSRRRHKHRHRHRHTNKMLKKKDKNNFSRRHRRRSPSVSSWNKQYTYESNIVNSEVTSNSNHKSDNDVQSIHGLKDFLQGKSTK